MGKKEKVCVTGAGGYLASWIVKFLLSQGYVVHGTVRDPSDRKNTHLKKLDNASENLQLFKTDLLDYEGLCAAIEGCEGIFHVACPVRSQASVVNPEAELTEPVVTGTRNVLNACVRANVKKVVVVSSIGAVVINRSWPKGQAKDEECWTDLEFCKEIKQWYCVAKTIAETEALEYLKRGELNIVTICPSIIIGPMLQSTMNSSCLLLLKYLRDGPESADNGIRAFVDVRDAADAILLVYERTEAEGRYICSSHEITTQDLVQKLKSFYPYYNYPKSFNDVESKVKLSSEKLKNLGWKYRPLEETLVDAVKNYEETAALVND